jgi:hypothetical protein
MSLIVRLSISALISDLKVKWRFILSYRLNQSSTSKLRSSLRNMLPRISTNPKWFPLLTLTYLMFVCLGSTNPQEPFSKK